MKHIECCLPISYAVRSNKLVVMTMITTTIAIMIMIMIMA